MADDSLRHRHRISTRNDIVDAYLELAHREGAAAISIPSVAEVAGLSVRTVYRYFATKDLLVDAASRRMSEQALAGDDMYATDRHDLADNLKRLWADLAEQMPAVIAEHTTPAGRDIRRTRLAAARARVAELLPDADAESIDLVIAVTSSSMLLELVDRMGYSPEVAAAMAMRLGELVLHDAVSPNPLPTGAS